MLTEEFEKLHEAINLLESALLNARRELDYQLAPKPKTAEQKRLLDQIDSALDFTQNELN